VILPDLVFPGLPYDDGHECTINVSCGLYYKCVTIVIDAPSVVKVTLQTVASLTIVIDDAS
jgi:hypothetical protein